MTPTLAMAQVPSQQASHGGPGVPAGPRHPPGPSQPYLRGRRPAPRGGRGAWGSAGARSTKAAAGPGGGGLPVLGLALLLRGLGLGFPGATPTQQFSGLNDEIIVCEEAVPGLAVQALTSRACSSRVSGPTVRLPRGRWLPAVAAAIPHLG